MEEGWISLNRKLQSHWIWKEKRVFSKAEAWIDILLMVNHSEQKVTIKNTIYIVNRGESIMSLDSWGKRWNWNKSKVRRFLDVLQMELMVVSKNETQTTRLTVCNYDSYQTNGNAFETQMKRKRNANETQTTPNNNDNNINNKNNENKNDFLFDSFWELYPKKIARSKCEIKFNKLSGSEKECISATLKDFLNYKPFESYTHPNPETYLNQKRWEDEIPKKINKRLNLGI